MKKSSSIDYLIISAAYPYRGGISDSTHSLVNQMSNQNISCEVWTFKLLYPKLFFPGKTQYSQEVFKSDFKIVRQISTLNPINWIITAQKINKIGPTKIILRYWTPLLSISYFIISCLLNNKTKVIGLVDNWSGHERILFEGFFRKLFIKSCDRFISFSENVAENLKNNTNKKVLPLFHPINDHLPHKISKDEALYNLNLPSKKYILFIGLIRKYKGVESLIKAFHYVSKEHKNLRLIIAGEFYDDITIYKKLIKRKGIEDIVIIDDNFLESSKIRDYICVSDIVVQPYKKASQSGITPVAYFYDKPLVVSNIEGLKEIIIEDQSGEIFDETPANLAIAIKSSINPESNKNYSNNIAKSKVKYSWSRFVKKIEVF
ncbi:MAG: glycosyltransferase [Bacteroidota bacterium]|nr:glycosyltransferase [Bacteroidota bacterium]